MPRSDRQPSGTIPNGWQPVSLDECVRPDAPICYGILMPGPHCAGGVPVVKVKDIVDGRVTESGLLFTHRTIDDAYKRSRLATGDVLVTIRGTTGRLALVSSRLSGANITQDTARVRVKDSVDSRFVYFALQSHRLQHQIALRTIGQAVKGINIRDVRALALGLPDTIQEQRAIAGALSDVDALLEGLTRLIAKKRDLKQAAMQQLLTGQTRLPGFHDAWEVRTVAEIERSKVVRLGRGQVISKKDIEDKRGDSPIYSSSVHNGGLFGCYGEFMFDEELITWSIDGGGNFFYRPKHKFSVTNVCGFMQVDTSRVSYRFLAAELQLLHSRKSFDYQSKAHPSVVRKEYEVGLPPLSEQIAIAAALSDMDAELSVLEARRDKTRALKQAMMQELLTGRTRLTGF